MSTLMFGSLFAGIGGIDLGLERAGWTCAWQVESSPYCLEVLRRHWPTVPKYEDVHDVGADELAPVDLIAGGFPCPPVSRAGNRLAQADERWLWPEFARIVCELRPRFVLVENVAGLLDSGLGDVLGDLSRIGYDAEWSSVSACSMGAPHVRRRVFIVAYANGKHGWPWLRDSAASAIGTLQTIDGFADSRAHYSARLANPSALYRGADGIPNRMERNRAIGNAVAPDMAEWIGRRLMVTA